MAHSRILVPLLALACGLAVYGAQPVALETLRHQAFDQLQRLHPRPYRDAGIRVVDLDDESLRRLGQWPWPRSVVADLVDRLAGAGVAAIAFDIAFAEPDRTGPARLAELWPELRADAELREGLLALPDPDMRLARSIARAPVVTGFFLGSKPSATELPSTKPTIHVGRDLDSERDPLRRIPRFTSAVSNLSFFEGAASGNGSANGSADPDGIHRRVHLLFRVPDAEAPEPGARRDRLVPSLSLEALRVAVGGDRLIVRAEDADGDLGISEIALPPQFRIPTDPSGAVWLHYTEDWSARTLPAWRVLEGDLPDTALSGTVVFVGTTAVGLRDQRPAPLDPYLPGVMLHAEFAEHVVLGHHLARPGFMLGAEWLATALFGLAVVLIVRFANALVGAALTGVVAASAFGLSLWAFTERLWLIDPVTPALGVLTMFLLSSVLGHLSEESQKRRVRRAFGHYLAPALVEELSADPERLQLGGEMRELSFLFCDVRGFTTLSERLEPEQLTRLVNRLLTPLTDVILGRRGTIDKYMGDCVMAFWNAPLDVPEHAREACLSALDMLEALDALNGHLAEEAAASGGAFETLRVGVGINTGLACVGNLGSEQRFDYSVIGDAVNLASRLEGQSKSYGVDVVIGDDTRAAVPELACLELDCIRVKGKNEPVTIHALLGDADRARRLDFLQLREHHEAMLKAYRAREWEAAEAQLDECEELGPELGALYELYRERIGRYRVNPPPTAWDGVFTATSK